MEKVKRLNVAIVGGGPGCKAIMDMIFEEKLNQLLMRLIGVASTNPNAVGFRYAQEMGVYTTGDYRDFYGLRDLNMIIELTGREDVAREIARSKPDHVRLIDHTVAHVFWDLFQIEEKRIADRRRSEEETKLAYAELNQVFETSGDAMRVIDKDFDMLRVNEAFLAMSGMTRDEVVGTKCYDLFSGPFCNSRACPVNRILKGEERVEYDAEKRRKDGATVPCIVMSTPFRGLSGELLGIVQDFKDITERKQAEEALQESGELLRATLDSTADGILAVNEAGQITHANRRFAEMWRIPKELIERRDDSKLLAYALGQLEEPETFLSRVKELYGTTKEDFGTLVFKDGRVLERFTSPLIRDERIAGRVWSFRDVTERRKAEDEKKRLEAQLLQAQKLEAVGTLAGGIAHDFNNLLMGIQGNVSLMLLDVGSAEPFHERLRRIEKQVERGVSLTAHLLGYARKGRYEVKAIDLTQLIEEVCETFGRTRKDITIRRDFAEEMLAVEVDPGQIEQVLFNLFVNAADAMSEGGDLVLKLATTSHHAMKGKLYDPEPGDYVRLEVIDTGVGMDNDTMERIFDPFFTTKEMGRGTGLGLASAYGIVKGHGGYVDVESEKGLGATFTIFLPASGKKVDSSVRPDREIVRATGTALLVDDEEAILDVGRELLEAIGYRVLMARDGREALRTYGDKQDDIDFVVLDMVMPNMRGGECFDRLKEMDPAVKVLLSSGYSIDGEATEILERGCDGFIQKPFNLEELSREIKKVVGT
ncbi:MAG: PAS domain S-box protein [Thermodesulfobacteriota bacterium]|nr:PAS domain S-box protein [Thermodesulfobacteriota bacterium]